MNERLIALLPWIGLIFFSVTLITIARRALVFSRPDEWLLTIRSGQLVSASVGAWAFRIPWQTYVRFSSTLQRVSFKVEARSQEHLGARLEGFLLWKVEADDEGPFRAFQNLGIANLQERPADRGQLLSEKHLLARPQHKAFQQLIAASVQRYTATVPLQRLLQKQDEVLAELQERLVEATQSMAVRIDQLQILEVAPLDEDINDQLKATQETLIMERATNEREEAEERMKTLSLEREKRLKMEAIRARMEHASFEDERTMALERERHQRAEERAQLTQKSIALEEATERLRIESDRALAKAKAEVALEPKRAQLAFELEAERSRAEAGRDAINLITEAEEKKSSEVRKDQLTKTLAEQMVSAVSALPIKDASWTTISAEAPLASVTHMIGDVMAQLKRTTEEAPGEDAA